MRRLLEWKDAKGNKINLNNKTSSASTSTTNYPSQKERYKKLFAQIDKEKRFNYEVLTLTDNALVFNIFNSVNNNKVIAVTIVYKPYTDPPVWKMGVSNGKGFDYNDWNEILEIFNVSGIIKDISSLKESFNSSIAEDFKEYESMWMTVPQRKVLPNFLYIIYCDRDDGSYDIRFANADLKIAKEVFKQKAIDFMFPSSNANQTINLLSVKLNELSTIEDKDFIFLINSFNANERDGRDFTTEENKLFSKYEKSFGSGSKFSVLKSFDDVEAYEEAIDQKIDPHNLSEKEWQEFVEEYVDKLVI